MNMYNLSVSVLSEDSVRLKAVSKVTEKSRSFMFSLKISMIDRWR